MEMTLVEDAMIFADEIMFGPKEPILELQKFYKEQEYYIVFIDIEVDVRLSDVRRRADRLEKKVGSENYFLGSIRTMTRGILFFGFRKSKITLKEVLKIIPGKHKIPKNNVRDIIIISHDNMEPELKALLDGEARHDLNTKGGSA